MQHLLRRNGCSRLMLMIHIFSFRISHFSSSIGERREDAHTREHNCDRLPGSNSTEAEHVVRYLLDQPRCLTQQGGIDVQYWYAHGAQMCRIAVTADLVEVEKQPGEYALSPRAGQQPSLAHVRCLSACRSQWLHCFLHVQLPSHDCTPQPRHEPLQQGLARRTEQAF